MKTLVALSIALPLFSSVAAGGGKGPPPLTASHHNAAETFTLKTPSGWTVESRPGQPEVTEARGDGVVVRVLRRATELGLDSMHVECMLVRLAPAMETFPQVDYEYDFLEGQVKDHRALDSAFVVHYDEPIDGHRDWRQRNLTLVGNGESLCVIGYAPLALWKKSKPIRQTLDAVFASLEF
jgi:hypothetical protein